jgi:biopolymer transport protein ExbB
MVDQIVAFALLGADWVLYLLAALSVLSIAVIVERGLFFHRRRIDHSKLQKEAVRAVREDTVNALTTRYKGVEAMAARVALAGVLNRDTGVQAASEAMNSAKMSAQEEYEQLTVVLGTLGNNAPFIGLFGTVLGIIKAFNDLQADPTGGINAVMGSTSEALVATAVGILVAIPAVVAFNFYNRMLRSHVGHSDALAHAILGAMHGEAHVSNDAGEAKKEKSKSKSKSESKDSDKEKD